MTRIVFMGTPEFAVPVLNALADRYNVVAVYTRADKPAGRGKALAASPVKQVAVSRRLPVEQPRTLRDAAAQSQLQSYQPDLIVVAAYGLILPPPVLDLPPRGCLNVHASLLPRWRGASPITYAILAGDSETGITLMQMDAGLDTGPIIAQRSLAIQPDDTTASLTTKLAELGAALSVDTLPDWLAGKITPRPQPEQGVTLTRLVKKQDGLVDWTRPAVEIERMVRAYYPWPTAYTFLPSPAPASPPSDQNLLKILQAQALPDASSPKMPGTVVRVSSGTGVTTGQGILLLRELQLAGRRAMTIDEFERGQRNWLGARLGA